MPFVGGGEGIAGLQKSFCWICMSLCSFWKYLMQQDFTHLCISGFMVIAMKVNQQFVF